QVHRSSRGESADRGWTPDRPWPAFSFLEFFEKVLLVVIEIRRHVPRIVFFCRSLVGAEVISVPPGALREVDVLERGRSRLDGLDQVEEHVGVRRYRLAGIR